MKKEVPESILEREESDYNCGKKIFPLPWDNIYQ